MLDTLQVPPFESEIKRASITAKAAAGTTTAKQTQLPVLESGTSVAPRQRPKASVQPVAHTLPIVAPPSPSPRNIVSSPVPATQSNPPSAEVVEEPPFTAQFQANFPPVQTPAAVTPQYSATASQSLQTSTSNSVTNVSQADGTAAAPDNLDALFESKFPDPFREAAAAGVPRSTRTGSSGAIGVDLGKVSAFGSQDVVMPLETVVATPTKTSIQQLLGAPKLPIVGHRRNMSDTSAFNKYDLPLKFKIDP